ncbi:MAG TPA: response regulator, partial [Verrucomicrobiae bacterium]|nr:response regulator [Verrucomicrobiae bacterium]
MQHPLLILHLEDSDDDAFLIAGVLREAGLPCEITRSTDRASYQRALETGEWDVVMVDNGLPGFDGRAALELARTLRPEVPTIVLSGASNERQIQDCLKAGACEYLLKDRPAELLSAIRRLADPVARREAWQRLEQHNRAMVRLVAAIQELSLARNLADVMGVARHAARELAGADGATFVLKDGGQCFYADEEAISPLWKGQRFP